MKRRFAAALLLAACFLTGTAQARAEKEKQLIIGTDLHYLSPALTDHGSLFSALTENADGKLMRYIGELTDAFLEEVSEQKPAALLLTGDLTFNGELLSHTGLASKLHDLEGQGVPVYVLPGNHDLNNRGAASFSGDSYTLVPSASEEDFRTIYADFGFDEAVSTDTDSLSYMAELDSGTRLLMMDFNTGHDPCGISEQTLRWTEQQLREAAEAGCRVIAAGHQNLYQQTMFRGGYVVERAQDLAELLRSYGAEIYLSGHLHCQHWQTEKGLTEIATSALSVFPCQYGILTMEEGGLSYETKRTDVPSWAAAHGRTDENLRDFEEWSSNFFDRRTRENTRESLSLFAYSEEETERMAEYITDINRAYFSGDMREAEALDPGGINRELFGRYTTLYTAYLQSVYPCFGKDYCVWNSEMNRQ